MNYIGIDLGTTNSAICSFDGEILRLHKSPDQFDVTPSAIFVDKRGNKFVGMRAYNSAPRNPENSATLFKRYMGSKTPINLPGAKLVLTPEQCSAEVIRTLCGYLPEEIWNDGRAGTVVTVPAAFNQMQKEATMSAAASANVGPVALMQEPVAAVISAVRKRRTDGMFVVFDLGGGTLDVAVAECVSGRVSLLAHDGIAMCGGRDFDLALFDQVVLPWLSSEFALPDDLDSEPRFKAVKRVAMWAIERAKIELSQRESSVISDDMAGLRDLSGTDLFLDIPIDRRRFDTLIDQKVSEAIGAASRTLEKAGLSSGDVERIVFVGGPTQYKPLRDRVAHELGIASSTDVNPMTAVAEGAAVFAESIDWSSQNRGRKRSRGATEAGGGLDLLFSYVSRTPNASTRVVAKTGASIPVGVEFQIDSLDTGWSSGRVALRDAAAVELPLSKPGENVFKVFLFDQQGRAVPLAQDRIEISRTAATVDAIPASHSVGVEAREKLGGRASLTYLVKAGDALPKKGKISFRSAESLKAGGITPIRFKLWEGEIQDPVSSNRWIGAFEIKGSDFADGVIAAGAELICDYEVLDSGQIRLEVTVPSIGGAFNSAGNFYAPQGAQIDYTSASKQVEDQVATARERLDEITEKVEDDQLQDARAKLDRAGSLKQGETDPEATRQALEDLQDVHRLMAEARLRHLAEIRTVELERCISVFDRHVRKFARPSEETSFDNLAKTARRAIESNSGDFEVHLDDLRSRNFGILWRQDWFVIDRFNLLAEATHQFPDAAAHGRLVSGGSEAVAAGDIDQLRRIVASLEMAKVSLGGDDDMLADANIVQG